MEARAMSLATHLPPETLAGDVQKWRDDAKGLLLKERAEVHRLRGVLERIASEDYRGNRSPASQLAHDALRGRTQP
jgi:hypothetical protein